MSYAFDVDSDDENVVLDKAVANDVTEDSVLRVAESSHAYLRGGLTERLQVRVGHHRVALGQLRVDLVDQDERYPAVERPFEAVVVFGLH